MGDLKLKLCPYRIYGEKRMSITIEGEYSYREFFLPCMGNNCGAFEAGQCKKNPYTCINMRKVEE